MTALVVALSSALGGAHRAAAPVLRTVGGLSRNGAGLTTEAARASLADATRPIHVKPHALVLTRAHSAVFDVKKLKSIVVKRERPEHKDPFGGAGAGMPATLAPNQMVQQSGASANTSSPGPDSSFDGLDFATWGAGHPPDENGDVGPTYFIETVNTSIGIYDKSNGNRVAAFTFNSFMSQGNFGNLCDTDNFGDPVVLYDSYENRWMITDFAFKLDAQGNVSPQTVYECFAVSKTGDPVNGGWNYYSIVTPGGLGDYPKFGIWPDGIYMGANMFDYAATGGYQGYHVWALNKQQMYADAPQVSVVDFATDPSDFTVIPVNSKLAAGAPPAGSPEYFVSTTNLLNGIQLYKFQVNWDKVTTSTFTGPFNALAPNCYPNAEVANASTPQNAADTLEFRAMAAPQYANVGGSESVWVAHTVQRRVSATNTTCNAGTGGNATIRWYQANVTGGTVAANVSQGSSFDPENANTYFRFQPALAIDRLGDMAVTYTKSNATTNPMVMYDGRLAGDAVNTLGTENTLIAGTGAQSGNCGGAACVRWGDYAGMELDPDGCHFWMTGEYYAANGLNDLTRIGSFHFPGCTPVGNGTLSGTVTNGASPLVGATITLGSRTTTTDASGAYSFSVPAGTYPSLLADSPGYTEGSAASLVVPNAGTLVKNFTLSAAAQSGCITDNSQSLFQRGVPTNCDLTGNPGVVQLAAPDDTTAQNASVSPLGTAFSNTSWAGQTFTPTVSGTLKRVDVELFCNACTANSPNVTLSIRATTGATPIPTGGDLATATLPGFNDGGAGGLKTFTLGSPLQVTAGTRYAFIFRLASSFANGQVMYTCSCVTTGYTDSNPYANGQRVTSTNSGSAWTADATVGGRDLHFVTYVNPGFNTSGTFVSSLKDANPAAGSTPHWTTLSWTATTPVNTAVKFQVAASNSPYGPWNYVGPNGTASTFFTTTGADLSQFNGNRYIRYEAFLSTTNRAATPTLSSVQTCFQDIGVTAPTTLAVGSASGTYGGTTTLTATLTSGGNGVPNETVAFTLNGSSVGGATTNASGIATLNNVSLTGIGAGSYPTGVGASFAGDATYSSSSGSNALSVSKAGQTIVITQHAPANALVDDQFTVAATGGGSGNAIVYGSSGSCTNTGANYTITGTGACTVTYNQAGNTNYNAAPQLTDPVNSSKGNQTIHVTIHAPASAVYGTGFSVAATGGNSGNPIVYGASGGCTHTGANFSMTSGSTDCTVTYDQAGSANYNAATEVTEVVTAQKASQTINVTTAAPSTAAYNSSFDVNANAPAGAVVFSSAGVCTNTAAHFTMTSGTGTCTVKFDQAGDANYNAATQVTESVTATKIAQSITFATPAAHTYGDTDFDPGATASSGFAVSYQASGACSIVAGIVHFTGAGSCQVSANQAGDANYSAAPQVQRTFAVNKAALSITADNAYKRYAQPLSLGTTAFTSSGLVGSDSVSGVTLTSAGSAANAPSGDYAIVPSQAVAGPNTDLANYTVSYANGTLHVLSVGLIGLNGVSVKTTSGKIDSFDSSLGPYSPTTNHGSAAVVMSNGALWLGGTTLAGEAISTQNAVTITSTGHVSGNVTAGTTVTNSGTVGGTVTQNSPSAALAGPTVAACAPFSAKTGISGGTFAYSATTGNLTVKMGTVKLASKTYCFNTIALAAGTALSVSGPVTIHLTGKITGAKAHIVNTTNNPANLHIDSSYAGLGGLTIVGGAHAYMTIVVPGASVTIPSGPFFGTVLAGTVNLTGTGTAFHADTH